MGNFFSIFFSFLNNGHQEENNVILNRPTDPTNTNDPNSVEVLEDSRATALFTKGKPRRALLVGINYDQDADKTNDLRGCENDLLRMSKLLVGKYHFDADDVNILNSKTATRENIESSLLNMVKFARSNADSELFFHFSGHGTQQGSILERDRKSESLCPVDYNMNGLITDRWLKRHFVSKLPRNCRLFCLIDCCHSGTNLNLCYHYDFAKGCLESDGDYKRAEATVVKISGCLDNQVSYDCYNPNMGIFNGALTDAFIMTCKQGVDVVEHVRRIRGYLKQNEFPQTPNLTMSGDFTNMSLN